MEFLFQSANSAQSILKESALVIFEYVRFCLEGSNAFDSPSSRAFPGIFGNQADRLSQVIHQIFQNCLNDHESKVRYTAVTALAAYLKNYAENSPLLNIYRDCLPSLIAVGFLLCHRCVFPFDPSS